MKEKQCKKEKDKYCILTNIYGIYKDGTDDPTWRAAKERTIKDKLLDLVEEAQSRMI